ncbi:hypothetical protein NUW58_g10226 [Xylaria curta]|uniref:Uncharacterized protein n=1 Tax=Xylaria curta TaxID=42375 RepID=A0ACC1MQ46_9PEZI|nr:hypothetical protein NUW58_g10226 [Xylaria curta]
MPDCSFFFALLDNIYTDAALDSEVYAMSRAVRSDLHATSGFSQPHVYLNYDFGDEGVAAQYGPSKLPKLRRLKKQWDRRNLFGAGTVPTAPAGPIGPYLLLYLSLYTYCTEAHTPDPSLYTQPSTALSGKQGGRRRSAPSVRLSTRVKTSHKVT